MKIKKGLEIFSRSHFSQNFFIKKFLLKYYINQPKFIPKLFIWMSEKLKFHYLKNEKSFWNEIKDIFYMFHRCSLLDIKHKLAKILRTQPSKFWRSSKVNPRKHEHNKHFFLFRNQKVLAWLWETVRFE